MSFNKNKNSNQILKKNKKKKKKKKKSIYTSITPYLWPKLSQRHGNQS